jgi:hypothetical protein
VRPRFLLISKGDMEAGRLQNDSGTAPVNLLLSKANCCNLVSCSREDGREPLKEFVLTVRMLSAVMLPKKRGREFVNLFVASNIVCNSASCSSEGGKAPSRELP